MEDTAGKTVKHTLVNKPAPKRAKPSTQPRGSQRRVQRKSPRPLSRFADQQVSVHWRRDANAPGRGGSVAGSQSPAPQVRDTMAAGERNHTQNVRSYSSHRGSLRTRCGSPKTHRALQGSWECSAEGTMWWQTEGGRVPVGLGRDGMGCEFEYITNEDTHRS